MPAPRCRDCDAPITFVECEGTDGKMYLNKFEPVPESVERTEKGWVKRVTLLRHNCPSRGGNADKQRIAELEARLQQYESTAKVDEHTEGRRGDQTPNTDDGDIPF